MGPSFVILLLQIVNLMSYAKKMFMKVSIIISFGRGISGLKS